METAVYPEYLEQFTYVLTIKDFNMCVNQECILSECFVANVLFETKWRLQVYPRGETNEDLEYVSCLLSREEDDGPANITIRITMGLIDKDSTEQEAHVMNEKRFQTNSIHGFKHFLERETLFKVKDSLLPKNNLTIFCRMERMWLKETQRFFAARYFGCKRNRFNWQVQAISKCSENERKAFIVQFEPEPKTQFEMSLQVDEEDVEVDIRRIGHSETELCEACCKIMVMNSKGDETTFWAEDQHSFVSYPDDIWLFPPFLKTADLNPTLLSEDILTLFCDFVIETGVGESRIEEIVFADWELPPLDTALISLHRDMQSLFDSNNHCDAELQVEENETISANEFLPQSSPSHLDMESLLDIKIHSDLELRVGESETIAANKFLLQDSSPVLKKMLEDVKDTNVLDIRDMDRDTLEEMLRFVYTDELDQFMKFDSIVKLFTAAHNYEMYSLKLECSSRLRSTMTVENVCEILVIAHTHLDSVLWEEAIDLISIYWGEISLSEEWEHLIITNRDLARETRRILKKRILDC